jgi:DNA N-6-adenine-methyltransferase (Dam)
MTLGSHQRTIGTTQVHLTPRWIIDALGPFDLDPCAADPRPWDCAVENITEAQNGLDRQWHGRVWLNPPFDRYKVGRWIGRLAEHRRGTALLHARTETEWFRICWQRATAMLFMAKRLIFVKPDGTPCTAKSGEVANSGAPPVLVAFGDYDASRLRSFAAAEHGGALVERWQLFDSLAICPGGLDGALIASETVAVPR